METNRWKKGEELVDGSERRTFTFLAESKDDRDLWLVTIKWVGPPRSMYLQQHTRLAISRVLHSEQ